MRYAIYGGLVGAVLGFALPLGLGYLICVTAVAGKNPRPGDWLSPIIVFALIAPFSAIGCALWGATVGTRRAKAGKWTLSEPDPSTLPAPRYLQALAVTELEKFDRQFQQLLQEDKLLAQEHYLQAAVDEYRQEMLNFLKQNIGTAIALVVLPFLAIVLLPIFLRKLVLRVAPMRRDLNTALRHWSISELNLNLDLPLSLRLASGYAFNTPSYPSRK